MSLVNEFECVAYLQGVSRMTKYVCETRLWRHIKNE